MNEALVDEAMKKSGLVWLTDSKGKQIAVSAGRIAYLEIEPERSRTVGFAAVRERVCGGHCDSTRTLV